MSGRAASLRLFIAAFLLIAALIVPTDRFTIQATGILTASPITISETLPLGQQVTRPLTITNLGSTTVTALLYEARAQPLLAMAHAIGPASVPLPQQDHTLDPRLAAQLDEPAAQGSFIIYLRDQADLSGAYGITDWSERGRFVYRTLVEHAERTQRTLRAELTARGLTYRPFWIVNAIRVEGALADAQALEQRADVALVRADASIMVAPQTLPSSLDTRCSADGNPVCWNIRAIRADRVWNEFGITGQGVTVASIDTGGLFSHPALRDQYRGALGNGAYDHNYNWYDPQGAFPAPNDQNGHGTHTIGIMVGRRTGGERFGVAPGARWIAAQGCEGSFCNESDLIAAAQWVLAPTDLHDRNPRPDLRPLIVNNSWAGGGNDPWYAGYTAAWRAAGIFPVFAAGNGMGVCRSIASPGDYADVVAVGATDRNDAIAPFSLRGPAADGRMKPDFVAPGEGGIYSTHLSDGYATLRGTSMAAPHVAGVVALLYSANPALIGDFESTYAILRDTARRIADEQCGVVSGGGNHVYGWGLIDAHAGVARARVDVPWLRLSSTTVTLSPGQNATLDVMFDAGSVAAPGTYTARIQIYASDLTHPPATVEVTMNVTASGTTVGGIVRDAETGEALRATVSVSGGASTPTSNDGSYALILPSGVYTLTASALSYAPQQRVITVPVSRSVDFGLLLDAPHLTLSTDHVTATLDFNTTVEQTVTITNTGTRPLTFEASVGYAPFGVYRSDEPGGPVYQWIDLPVDAPTLELTDTTRIDNIPLGFDFPLYTLTVTETSVTSDGTLSFGWPSSYTGLVERCLPGSEAFFYLLAPFRADLDPARGGQVRYGTVNSNATFVVSFENVPLAQGPPDQRYTFQAFLHRDGRIVFQYADLSALPERLSVGVQKTMNQVQRIGCGADTPVTPGLAIEFRPQFSPEGWLEVAPDRGTVAPGDSATLRLAYRWQGPPQGARLRTTVTLISSDPRRRNATIMAEADMRPAPYAVWLGIVAR
ncbi:MAG: peptidase S8 [Roseiflexus castenholzii]|uniref:S8 family serine peptidase n=1 Tax=Roseiflexus castenholzii TaxID=120962 RepID=UPI000CB32B3E|nr:MAG: peptidase S8 [Roseiflexus castenholzii]